MDANTLSAVMGCSIKRARQMVDPMNEAMVAAEITNVNRAAMWCAQIGHESMGLVYMEEIASGTAYEGRRDLGNVNPGDGRRFKGSGPIQLTGRHNFDLFSKWAHKIGKVDDPNTFVRSPQLVRENPRWGFLAASWYWVVARPNINSMSDRGDVHGVTRAINGGLNGIGDRLNRYARAKRYGKALLPDGKPSAQTTEAWEPTGDWSTKRIQHALGLKEDGEYGPTTTATVKAWQEALGLTADGLWGPGTEAVVASIEEKIDKIAVDVKQIKTDLGKTPARVWSYKVTTPKSVSQKFKSANKTYTAGGLMSYSLFDFYTEERSLKTLEMLNEIDAEIKDDA